MRRSSTSAIPAYSFLPELAHCRCQQVSLEAAQPNLDCAILAKLRGKKIMLGVIDLGSPEVETPEQVAARIRRALPYVAAENIIVAPDCGMKYLPHDVAFGKLKAMVAGAAHPAEGDGGRQRDLESALELMTGETHVIYMARGTAFRMLRWLERSRVAVAMPVMAQTAELEEIVVTARKRDESLLDVPVAVNAVHAKRTSSPQASERPQDFIALTPNMTMVQTQNQGTSFIIVRGISQARNSEPSVAVLIDGVLMANPSQFNQELFDIESIEVLKGPQGALYGRNAIGGAIIIRTKEPARRDRGRGDGAATTPARGYRVRGSVERADRRLGHLKFRASGSYFDTDGYIDNPFLGEQADPFEDLSGARCACSGSRATISRADCGVSVSQRRHAGALFQHHRNDVERHEPAACASTTRA